VSRFRSSQILAAPSDANFGIKGHQQVDNFGAAFEPEVRKHPCRPIVQTSGSRHQNVIGHGMKAGLRSAQDFLKHSKISKEIDCRRRNDPSRFFLQSIGIQPRDFLELLFVELRIRRVT
jgi:hypothetical protein